MNTQGGQSGRQSGKSGAVRDNQGSGVRQRWGKTPHCDNNRYFTEVLDDVEYYSLVQVNIYNSLYERTAKLKEKKMHLKMKGGNIYNA